MCVDNSIVTLDDTDPQLQWSGPWFTTENSVDDLGNSKLGPPFLGTLHGISNNGSLFFSFYRRVANIWGALRPRNTSGGPDPNWQCLLDGQDPWPYPDRSHGNYMFCGSPPLPEGNHTLQLNTVIQSEPLYVYQVLYQAVATVDIGSAWTQVDQRDGRIKYSAGWENSEDGGLKWTYTPGAWLTFDFVGMCFLIDLFNHSS
ncbi:hypothetical protein EST38_g3332 [Candolleomyces aberdarensis]|uniref:Uncharacterized protein n=1 Tax=Candolleomyces aberdarensis TaxID=2316362 RepID=A0A4Q2DR25_9AGAR|nr:hypothetical protein EST38_g3332 [Candolleomyces aberdarensis]